LYKGTQRIDHHENTVLGRTRDGLVDFLQLLHDKGSRRRIQQLVSLMLQQRDRCVFQNLLQPDQRWGCQMNIHI
jgi:hypothetical protein